MDVFVSRQPIFNRAGSVFGYQLVCRDNPDSVFARSTRASVSDSLDESLTFLGLESLANGKRVFVNLTREALVGGAVPALPPERAIIEIPDDPGDDEELLAACTRLRDGRYELALPQGADPTGLVLPLISYAKIDSGLTRNADVTHIVREMERAGIKVLAEGVSTNDEFARSRSAGISLFRGFFFVRPNESATSKEIPAFKAHYLQVMRQLQQPDIDMRNVEEIVRRELSLSYKCLRYINSAYYGLRTRIKSVRHALAMLGLNEVRRLIAASVFTSLAHDKPQELVAQATIRARFCESIAREIGLGDRADELFTMGMWSLVDTILDRPMKDVLVEMPMSPDVEAALLGTENLLHDVLACTIAYERGNWTEMARLAAGLRLAETAIPRCYAEAIDWSQQVFSGARGIAAAA